MSKALLKYIRLSPTKARLIAREIQGMNAELALATLEFAPNKAAKVIYKVLASAIANGNYDAQSVVVKSCRIDAGPVLRRMSPRARGRANMIRKPTAHILVEVDEPQKAQKDSKPKNTNQKKLDSTKTPKSAPKAPKKENAAESKSAESSKKITPKVAKAQKDLGDSNAKLESKSTKDLKPKAELKADSTDSNAESKPKTKKPSATKTAKTTTSEDK